MIQLILPNKYMEPNQSLFYLGATILRIVNSKKVDLAYLWIKFKNNTKGTISYTRYMQTIVYLYSIGAISYNEEGEIFNENIES